MAAVVVIDASLMASFLLREAEGRAFEVILLSVSTGEIELHVPALFGSEMANILRMAERRRRITPAQADALLSEWELIPLKEDAPPSPAVRRRIVALARAHGLTAYDAAYVELAQRLRARLHTLDRDILKLARTFDWIG